MTVRVAIIGCGAIADYLHAPAVWAADGCILRAMVDSDLNRAASAAQKYPNVLIASSLQEVAGQVDLAVLATPPHVRVLLVEQALAFGLHVLCEKPLANTVAECQTIQRLAEQANRIVAVCHQFRFWPNRRQIQKTLGNDNAPRCVEVSQGTVYNWNSASGYTVRRELVTGGVLINAGTHPMDTLISWFGDPSEFEYEDDSCGGLESNVRMSTTFANGTVGKLRLSRTCLLKNEICLYWHDYAITMTNNDPFAYTVHRVGADAERVYCGSSGKGYLQPAIDLYNNLADAIHREGAPEVDAIEGTRVIQWVESCYEQKRIRFAPELAPLPGLTW
jgi:predicted dehydrogenase